MDQEVRTKVLKLLRNLLLSSKGGVQIEILNRDYNELFGENVPFRKFGFNSLYEFLDAARDYCRVHVDPNGLMIVRAVADEETKHLAALINKQLSVKKKSSAPKRRPSHLMLRSTNSSASAFSQGRRPPNRAMSHSSSAQRPMLGFQQGPTQRRALLPTPSRFANLQPSLQSQQSMPVTQTLRSSLIRQAASTSVSSSGDKQLKVTIYKSSPNRAVQSQTQKPEVEKTHQEDHSSGSSSSNLEVKVDVLHNRICELVQSSKNGVWSSRLEVEYKRIHKQDLPTNWIILLEAHQTRTGNRLLTFDKRLAGRYLIASCINEGTMEGSVERERHEEAGQKQSNWTAGTPTVRKEMAVKMEQSLQRPQQQQQSVTSESRSYAPDSKMLSPMSWRSMLKQRKLPELVLPEDDLLDVNVLEIISASVIRVRLFGQNYDEALSLLTRQMQLFYDMKSEETRVKEIKEGHIYCLFVEECWQRVEALKTNGSEVQCCSIDYGGEAFLVCVDQLREVHSKFLDLAPQAFSVELAGLENFSSNHTILEELRKTVQGNSYVGEVFSANGSNTDESTMLSLVLYDTSTEEDIIVNKLLVDAALDALSPPTNPEENCNHPQVLPGHESPAGSPPPAEMLPTPKYWTKGESQPIVMLPQLHWQPVAELELPPIGRLFDVNITVVKSPSQFMMQPLYQIGNMSNLQSVMNNFYSSTSNLVVISAQSFKGEKYCAAKFQNLWTRAKILGQPEDQLVKVQFLDTGDEAEVNLHQLQPLWPHFRKVPPCAVKASLAGLMPNLRARWTLPEVDWFINLTTSTSLFCRIEAIVNAQEPEVDVSLYGISNNIPVDIKKEMIRMFGCLEAQHSLIPRSF